MARNGAGVYVLPAGQPVVTGATISSTTFNALTTDLANALTTSIASDGQTAMAANLPMGGNKLTGLAAATVAGDAIRFEQGAMNGVNTDITALNVLGSVNGGQLAGFRNRIINGGMQVAQRAATTLTNVLQYGQVDRWQGSIVGGTGVTGTLTRGTGIPGFASGSSCLMSGTSFTVGKPYWETRLESLNVQDLNLKTITISGKLFQDTGTTQTFQVGVTNATVADTFTTQNTLGTSSGISVPSGTPTPFSFTVAISNTSVVYGVAVQVYLTSGITVSNKNFALGDAQLEVGAVATPLEQRFYGIEVALCQRYGSLIGAGCAGGFDSTTRVTVGHKFPVEMRIIPNFAFLTQVSLRSSNAGITSVGVSVAANSSDTHGMALTLDGWTGGVANAAAVTTSNNWAFLSAEL